MSETKERWYITTDFFRNGGKVVRVKTARGYTDLGPWPSRDEALACRYGFEQGSGNEGAYAVDQWVP